MNQSNCNEACNGQPEVTQTASTGETELGTVGSSTSDVVGSVSAARQAVIARAARGADGRFVRDNAAAIGDGMRSERLQTALEPLREAIVSRALTDLGYTSDDAPQTALMAVRDLAALDVMSETFWAHLLERGCITQKGKTTAAVAKMLAVLDRKAKLIAMLGLQRKAKPTASPLDYINGRADV
jgi:hypothetical protein